MHPVRQPGQLWRVVLSVSRVALRQVRAYPHGSRATQPGRAPVQVRGWQHPPHRRVGCARMIASLLLVVFSLIRHFLCKSAPACPPLPRHLNHYLDLSHLTLFLSLLSSALISLLSLSLFALFFWSISLCASGPAFARQAYGCKLLCCTHEQVFTRKSAGTRHPNHTNFRKTSTTSPTA